MDQMGCMAEGRFQRANLRRVAPPHRSGEVHAGRMEERGGLCSTHGKSGRKIEKKSKKNTS